MSDQFIGQTLAEKYLVDSELRDGDLGKTYRATHLLMEKPVIVKILPPALGVDENIVNRFSAEARAASHLSHPNILNVTDFGKEKNGAAYIVFEGADGATLKDEIGREGKFSFDRAFNITKQICAALSAAHAAKLIHRRLNSENILLTNANNIESVKVADFGAVEANSQLHDGNFTKNLEYLSPEQNSSIAEADARSDVYSLGVILYEMLTGELPFQADNPTDLLMKQARNPPAPLSAFRSDLPGTIELVILKALAKNPEMRYQTIAEFSRDLSSISTGGEAFAASNVAPDISETAKNNLWKTAFVVLAGISLLAVGLIYMTSSKQTNPTTTLQADANGQPVQPLNPATGMNELGAANMMAYPPQQMPGGANMPLTMPQTVPNSDGFGDGYNPWARGVPPPGAPTYVPPAGQTIDPTNPNSIFMSDGTILVPVPTNSNANVKSANTTIAKPTPATTNANVAVKPSPVPANSQPTLPKTTNTPAPKPSAQPTKAPPAATEKRVQSGKEQDS